MTDLRIPCIVLAAGMSTRMGRPKLLLPLSGRPMLWHVIESVVTAEGVAEVIVVAGSESQEIERVAAEFSSITVVTNAHYEAGMLSSIKCGIAAVRAGAPAFLLALGDQPAVGAATVDLLIDGWRSSAASIAVPVYSGKRGHPILIGTDLVPEILALPDDASLRDVVRRHAGTRVEISVDDSAVIADIDTPEQYAEALRTWETASKV